MKKSKMEGYKEAEKFDGFIKTMLKSFPIDNYPMEWLRFTRTVGTSLGIIETVAKNILARQINDKCKEN